MRVQAEQFRDSSPSEDGLQRRFYELRFDAEKRELRGTAMRYGDIAKLPWGEKERFVAGAFAGSLSDIILNVQHDRGRPLARTGGGGLRMDDSATELRLEAVLPKTREADDVIELVRQKILRGFSVEFLPISHRVVDGVTVIEKAELRNVGLVDRPAYRQSKVQPRSEQNMGEEEIRKLIEAALKKRDDDKGGDIDVAELVRSITKANADAVTQAVKDQIADALKERDDAEAERKKAEKERKEAEEKATRDREKIEQDAEARATTIADCRAANMFADDFDPKGKTRKECMIAALGDEVDDAENRSEDYLEAKLEGALERRAAADKQRRSGNPGGNPPANDPAKNDGGGVNIIRMIETRRHQKRTAA